MSTGISWIDCILGLVVLTFGAEWLVRGASRLAISVGISALVVGLTVVAYGTSTPELVVSLTSSLEGKSDVALGNVVGSNSFNVLFILGICALLAPLKVDLKLIRWEAPLLIVLSGAIWLAVSPPLASVRARYSVGLVCSPLRRYTSNALAYSSVARRSPIFAVACSND